MRKLSIYERQEIMKSYILKSPFNMILFLGQRNGKPHFGIESDDSTDIANLKAWKALGEILEKYGTPTPLKTSFAYAMELTDEQLKEIDETGLLDSYAVNEKNKHI